ncbi:replication protein A 32 kDa subunit [Cylas formicarius]|uniref:replication protein A 32 kDa subunit n=1 Tax=Cylas formicarius TaxID=197179 RepID=UPI002958DE60|nr:replication protein A 32 kDa subunit [Cylas formicarius]
MNTWNPGFNDTGAGGFLNNTTNFDSPATKKKNVKRLQSVVPVVIRQIRDQKEDEFKLFKLPAQMIKLVGILKECDMQSTKATYRIEDHTGYIKAVWWLDSDGGDGEVMLPPVKEGAYVQVFGTVRSGESRSDQSGEKMIIVLKMFVVEDANVITNHLLEVIHIRLQAEAMDSETVIPKNNPGSALANSMTFFDEGNGNADSGNPSFTAVQQKVFKILQADNTTAGPSKTAILSNFGHNQQREARDALEFLVNEGHAYSTIDNDHFKATDA